MAAELDFRGTMQTNDNEIVYTYYRGIIIATLEVFDKVQKGEDVDPSEYYLCIQALDNHQNREIYG